MEPIKVKRDRPEQKIQDKVMQKLRMQGWFIIKTHGNQFQSGLPDLYATHSKYGQRWIEMKTPEGRFTAAQRDVFPKLSANGTRIWVLVSAEDHEIQKIFGPENWYRFLKW